MSELTVLLHPDPRLKKTCIPVTNIDKSIKKLCLDMIETMYKYSGVGLAASQVGILKRVVVMDCSEEGEKKPKILINPEIIWSSEDVSLFEEGCLSIPDIREEIKRPSSVRIKFTDIRGVLKEDFFEGLWATCIQHEIDHLNGKLFIDYLGPIKRSFITKKMKKYKKEINKK